MPLGWPERQREALERQELKAAHGPPSHRHAIKLLAGHRVDAAEIVAVHPDAVLFLAPDEQPMTAWLERSGSRVRVFLDAGFPAWRTELAVEQRDEDGDMGDVFGPFDSD